MMRIGVIASMMIGWVMGYERPMLRHSGEFRFPVARSDMVSLRKPRLVHLFDDPLVMYRSVSNSSRIIAHSDICPHMGAALHKGWLDSEGILHCPYHGFGFDDKGAFCGVPNPIAGSNKRSNRIILPTSEVMETGGHVFVGGGAAPFFPPEHTDPEFRVINGFRTLDQYQDIVTENLLDMLHISYVHSFGSRLTPVPFDVSGGPVGDNGWRTKFLYMPSKGTISTEFGGATTVVVDNEFYLPSTTITRVKAGKLIKTVHTMTCPTAGKSSILFWQIYRNFWRDPFIPEMDVLGDALLRFFMEKTIDEDAGILSTIYEDDRMKGGLLTKYDMTIRKYRQMVNNFIS